ncbi:hypothetical protein EDD58_101183 [Hazenella coriacea]|uniref:Uncharacterized protein n=1 Tax=Hazenella coriacea TaxID=1179467 RepID=A0A4R3LA08_9BACL|nr:hypothetical protein EDD58_101183 [Hazenella coriacea]
MRSYKFVFLSTQKSLFPFGNGFFCLFQLYDGVDLVLSIVVNLGLEKYFLKAKMSISQNEDTSPPSKSEIEDAIKEVGEHISIHIIV